ncbi:DUF6284 family protein [Streptomyces sp. NPDC091281]|uniref:DUF6284 family protein n=1 Tax=Streptomyces sp. NPDC091281 TaxID=3365985 RepID=UPI0038036819
MEHIGADQAGVTADSDNREPTAAELHAIENEWPAIEADVKRLDALIKTLNHHPDELSVRRVRRAQRRVLAARRALVNGELSGGAA